MLSDREDDGRPALGRFHSSCPERAPSQLTVGRDLADGHGPGATTDTWRARRSECSVSYCEPPQGKSSKLLWFEGLQCRKDPNVHRIGALARRSRSDGAIQIRGRVAKRQHRGCLHPRRPGIRGNVPNEVYSTIIPLLLGGAAVPVRSFGSRQSCVLPRCARPLSCWVTQFAPQHIPCRRTKLSRSIPVRASSTCRREHVFRAVTHLSDVSHFGGTGKSIS
jgi:hypothetical protein